MAPMNARKFFEQTISWHLVHLELQMYGYMILESRASAEYSILTRYVQSLWVGWAAPTHFSKYANLPLKMMILLEEE